MTRDKESGFYAALQDFQRARRKAQLEQLLARLRGQSVDLLSYEDVRQKLKGQRTIGSRTLRDIPLDAIVGSVGRYGDFTRSFLPKREVAAARWASVNKAAMSMTGWPPIEVYQIGDVYFVLDGHHRVSVARQLGASHIEAYVTEVRTRVPLSARDKPEDLILKAEYADFLEKTGLDKTCSAVDLAFTEPGQYRVLEEHIEVHRYFMGLEQQREIPYTEAAAHWCKEVYLPIVEVIREQGILREFPDRTEADLYVWVSRHRAELEEALEWGVDVGLAAADLAARARSRPGQVLSWLADKVFDNLLPERLEPGPPAGQWHQERVTKRRGDRLFADVLVAVNGQEGGWRAVEQALEVARREDGRLLGLHVVPDEVRAERDEVRHLQEVFERHCAAAGVKGKLVIDAGQVHHQVCERAQWSDLVVLSLAHPPRPRLLSRLRSGFSTLLEHCPRPVLTVPGEPSPLRRALLAYDDSPKAQEALFIAAYLAGRWGLSLFVLTVLEKGETTSATLDDARSYLAAREAPATFIEEHGPPAEVVLEQAHLCQADVILMGGYGQHPLVNVLQGSTVDRVLRAARQPLLITR